IGSVSPIPPWILLGIGSERKSVVSHITTTNYGFELSVTGSLVNILFIVSDKQLHKPMYLPFCYLAVVDILYTSSAAPTMIGVLLTGVNTISYVECLIQMSFFIHIYAAGTVFNLSAMAYDRYIAICYPLQYSTVMTNAHIMRIITIVWMSCLVLIAVLFFLLLRLPRCRSEMTHVYCDNPSLLTLVCADTTINNIYDTKAKALQTCATHLIKIYGFVNFNFPPTLNPIIYGLKTKEIPRKGFTIDLQQSRN
uniref:G-protein coupled receptors family 1 profile domain-containing protein n=1 Tax=Maylandia zebra TaxID=106582 RepID=A0A3P9BUZ8_9CICH